MTSLLAADYWRPTSFEVATSWVHGLSAVRDRDASLADSPRGAFEAVVLTALRQAPCFVAFSGGRDSSAVLAVATHLARRHGLPEPVPVTEIYPGVPESDESEWQELVMSHLRLREWVRLEFPDGNDLVGAEAQESLRSRGLLWPVALHSKPAVLRRLGGTGSYLTGEGGDEVLGRRRGAQVSRLWRRGVRRLRPADLRSAGSALAPRAFRCSRERARLDAADWQPWLRPEAREQHHRLLAADLTTEPLSTARSLQWLVTRRAAAMASHNYAVLAADHGLVLHEPLLEPRFVRTLARAAGTWGYASRTDAMRSLFADVLPEAILSRRSKAYFNRAFMGQATRAFAEQWDGSGLDPELVDVEVLRAEWLSDFPSAIATPLLHAAWLAATPAHQDGAR
ncbi:asparagine synthase-related protein [Nocardioides xinjiangensis]|uniref:asparagine synthase-related protein n=1 Tax=Nocardioides xinjiangensis TaxID=2817376 RepID=UPI001B307376|nr:MULTISPECIES: asparagine synthase C-terminal domain-containing protein [unclassified Nocardioides]